MGAEEKRNEEDRYVLVNPKTGSILKESDLSSHRIWSHGYFPKEIALYIAMRLREGNVACEIGYDVELARSPGPDTQQLKNTFKDVKPFYFVAFPLDSYKKAIEILEDTSYPLKSEDEAEAAYEGFKKKSEILDNLKTFRKKTAIFLAVLIILCGLFGLYWLVAMVFE